MGRTNSTPSPNCALNKIQKNIYIPTSTAIPKIIEAVFLDLINLGFYIVSPIESLLCW